MSGNASRQNGKAGGRPRGSRSAKTIARERGRARALKHADITAERVMLQIARRAFTDRRGIWRDGRLKPLTEWTADEAALLEGLEVVIKNAEAGDGHTDTVHKVKLANADPSLDILAKHFGISTTKLEVTGKLTLEQLIAASLVSE